MGQRLLEICVDDAEGLDVAIRAGADRIELCAGLSVGGLTPSPGLMAKAARGGVPVYAMIRARAGDFVSTPAEIATMEGDIAEARRQGLAGVVLGASLSDGRLDVATLARLVQAAEGMGQTLHRAFDLVPDMDEALAQAVSLGFERILTSGGATTAEKGIDTLARLASKAGETVSIMPGSGVNAANVARLARLPGVREVHASGSAPVPWAGARVLELGFDTPGRKTTDDATIRALKAALLSA